jgi:L-alanine-DL-glutamate epimerase-like enolase superfamily enzyme
MAINARWQELAVALRNLGRRGIGAMALATVDTALWDLKARCLGLPLAVLLGMARPAVPVYGSGGFTSYDNDELRRQLGDWVEAGLTMVKMKVGRQPAADAARVAAARTAIGPAAGLFVDANGAYTRKQALAMAEHFAASGVAWFEEPVSSDDVAGLRLLRDRGPAGMAIAAGEYGY